MSGNVSLENSSTFFEEHGYLGPFTLFTPDEMADMWKEVRIALMGKKNVAHRNSELNYDRHLDLKILSDIASNKMVTERITAVIGPDVLNWRTEWFPKYPGDEGTDWHQAQSFVEFEGEPKLVPTANKDGTWELTSWFAFSDATKENGCMKIVPKSHKTWYFNELKNIQFKPEQVNQKIVNDEKSGFYGYDYDELKLDPNWSPTEEDALHMEMKAGQFFIFTSRLLHGSNTNITVDDRRFGWACRYVPTHVQIYPGRDRFQHFGEEFSLERYAPVLVSGQNSFDHNKEVRSPL